MPALDADDARSRELGPLGCHERVPRPTIGHDRPTVGVLVSALEKAGVLNVGSRWVTLANRNRLKDAACECYDVIRKTYEVVGR